MRLNLGCGDDIRETWLNVDIDRSTDADRHMDLEKTPWPWERGSAERILMDNVLEHIDPRERRSVLLECHRVLEPGGRLTVVLPVPEYGGGWDVTHYAVPTWRWPHHPEWRDLFEVALERPSVVGPGRLLPSVKLAKLLTRFGVARCFDSVTTVCVKR